MAMDADARGQVVDLLSIAKFHITEARNNLVLNAPPPLHLAAVGRALTDAVEHLAAAVAVLSASVASPPKASP